MTRQAATCLVLSLLAIPAAAATSSGRTSAFTERSDSMRASVSAGTHSWSRPTSCERSSTTCPTTSTCRPAPTTQIIVVNVNAPVRGDVVVVTNGTCSRQNPLLVGSGQTIARRDTVQPTLNALNRVVVRRW